MLANNLEFVPEFRLVKPTVVLDEFPIEISELCKGQRLVCERIAHLLGQGYASEQRSLVALILIVLLDCSLDPNGLAKMRPQERLSSEPRI